MTTTLFVAGREIEADRSRAGHPSVQIAQAALVGNAERPAAQAGAGLRDVEPALVESLAALGEQPATGQGPDGDRAAHRSHSALIVAGGHGDREHAFLPVYVDDRGSVRLLTVAEVPGQG